MTTDSDSFGEMILNLTSTTTPTFPATSTTTATSHHQDFNSPRSTDYSESPTSSEKMNIERSDSCDRATSSGGI
jgi:hypothetical protein